MDKDVFAMATALCLAVDNALLALQQMRGSLPEGIQDWATQLKSEYDPQKGTPRGWFEYHQEVLESSPDSILKPAKIQLLKKAQSLLPPEKHVGTAESMGVVTSFSVAGRDKN